MVGPHLNASPTRPQGVFWLAFGAALALGGQALWHRFGAADLGDPVAIGLAAVEKQDRLTVFSAQLSPVVSADDAAMFGVLRAHQVAVIPARVDYTLDMGKLSRASFGWDKAAHRLTVILPPLELSRPNLDEGHAQYLSEGVWISREMAAKLTRNNTLLAEQQAAQAARADVLMGMARDAARAAMRQNLAAPMQAAGLGNATVEVRFAGEKPAG